MNQITIIGRVGKDAELVQFGTGQMAKFSVATTEKWKDAQGETKEHTDWHNVIANGKQADTLAKWVKKGMLIMVNGKVKYSSYENKEGQKVYTTNIVCNTFEFLSKVENNNTESSISNSVTINDNFGSGAEPESDLPF